MGIRCGSGPYLIQSPVMAQRYEGTITVTKKGFGFLARAEEEEDLIIMPEHIGTAITGDTVAVESLGMVEEPRTKQRRESGKVIEVLHRGHDKFVGKLVEMHAEDVARLGAGAAILVPDWKRMHVPLIVRGDSFPYGHKVVVSFKGWNEGEPYPWGTVDEIIGPAGVHETEMRALALSQGFRADFPPGVVAEARALEADGVKLIEEEVARGKRRDMREVPTFTIDPVDAKDFDDALSFRDLGNDTYEIGVHIADVSFFVKPGTAIDDEARRRATSVYLVDRTIPMLPHVLSTNLNSLNPDVDRLAMSAVFILDKQAGVIDRWFGETIIHSDKRFAYEEAQQVLDSGEGPFLAELQIMNDLAHKMRARREKSGAIAFDTPEVKVELDETGKPIAVHLKERRDTNLLIEDFMLLANVAVAERLGELTKQDKVVRASIYRIHDEPDADRIQNLSEFLKVLGYHLPVEGGTVKGTDINELLKRVEGKPEEYLIKVATLRSMAKAVYSIKNIGHYGLAFSHYTHFTSPIRRYPDLLIHRLLKHFTNDQPVSSEQIDELEPLATHSSEREVSAAEAERDSVKMKLVEFMMERVGESFDAVISGVSDRGIYVELTETHAEGMVRIRDLGEDYFIYDEKRYRIVGERTKKQFSLGDPIRVTLAAARLQERELDFTLAQT